MIDSLQSWWVVYRRRGRRGAVFQRKSSHEPIAAFALEGLAMEWVKSQPHRENDLVVKKQLEIVEP